MLQVHTASLKCLYTSYFIFFSLNDFALSTLEFENPIQEGVSELKWKFIVMWTEMPWSPLFHWSNLAKTEFFLTVI